MKKYQHFINIIIALLLLAILLIGGIFYIFQVLKSKNENISKSTNYLSSETSRGEYVISAKKMLQSIDNDINRVRNLIIPTSGDVEFIENLESVARNNGLTIDIESLLLENDPKITQTGVTVLRIKAKTKGSWANTYKFIAELEALPYKIKINSILMSKVSDILVGEDVGKITSKSYWSARFDIGVLKYK